MTKQSNIKNKKNEQDLFTVIESIHKISVSLKDIKTHQALFIIIESIYKIATVLKNTKKEKRREKTPNKVHQIILNHLKGLKTVLRSDYFESQQGEILEGLRSSTSSGQLKSKVWLVNVLKERKLLNLGNVFLCAGWYGLLSYVLLHDEKFSIKRMFNFEKDPLSVKISEDLNRKFVKSDWKFKATLKDIFELNYHQARFNTLKADGSAQTLVVSPDTIINTSCEHIAPFSRWWSRMPKKKLLILQSNNFFHHKDHSNCVSSLKDFKKQAPLNLVYEGELDLKEYKRFMLIGYKK